MSDIEKINPNFGKREVGVSRTDASRPSKEPEGRDEFKKLVERRGERSSRSAKHDDDDKNVAEAEDAHSVFDLVAKKVAKARPDVPSAAEMANAAAAAATDVAKLHTESSGDLAGLQSKTTDSPTTFARHYVDPREDLAQFNPPPFSVASITGAVERTATGGTTAAAMQALIDQLVDKLSTVKTGDVTDMIISIKHPPLLEGSQLVVTSFGTAHGEFNLAFTNLTQEAKALLDSQRSNLMNALEQKGYVTHIVVTTTEPHERTIAETNPSQANPQQRGEQNEEERKRQQDQGKQQR
jgi:hypothetical protein